MIPKTRSKSVTLNRNDRSRSVGTSGHDQSEWVVILGRNTHGRGKWRKGPEGNGYIKGNGPTQKGLAALGVSRGKEPLNRDIAKAGVPHFNRIRSLGRSGSLNCQTRKGYASLAKAPLTSSKCFSTNRSVPCSAPSITLTASSVVFSRYSLSKALFS